LGLNRDGAWKTHLLSLGNPVPLHPSPVQFGHSDPTGDARLHLQGLGQVRRLGAAGLGENRALGTPAFPLPFPPCPEPQPAQARQEDQPLDQAQGKRNLPGLGQLEQQG